MIAIGLSRPSRTRTVDWANIVRLAAFRAVRRRRKKFLFSDHQVQRF